MSESKYNHMNIHAQIHMDYRLRARTKCYHYRIYSMKDGFKWKSYRLHKTVNMYRFNRHLRCAYPYHSKYELIRKGGKI